MAAPVTTNNLAPSTIAAEQRAREFLARGQWRKARDELKPLTKIDRPRFLPLLIKANIGLSREMMARGQVEEAQQVLSYLAGIATADQMRMAELELGGADQPSGVDLGKLVDRLAGADGVLAEGEKLSLADQLVLSFQEAAGGGVTAARVLAELKAVHEGLLAVSLQQWDRLAELLRPIPHRSAFAHWSAFLRGVAAFHTGDSEKAERFLANLPENTVPAKAGRAYLLWLRPKPPAKKDSSVSEIELEGAGRLLGQPGLGRLLLRADQLWRSGRQAESYRVLRDAVPGFPAQSLDWLGTLTDFYFNAVYSLPESDRDAYLEAFDGWLADSTTKNRIEEMLAHRMFARGHDERWEWEQYLRLRERLYGENPQFASLVYGRLGEHFAALEPNPFQFGQVRPVDGKEAVACLRKAITLDPNNLEAHLALANVYGTLRQLRERNRLLDGMVKRFPNEERVLIQAGATCIDRQAYVKGLDYLERARRLDQLDPQIPQLMVTARRWQAEQCFRQHHPDKGRQAFAAAEPFLTDQSEDLQRGRWTARLHHGLMERVWGDRELGTKLLMEAQATSPFPSAFLLLAHLSCRPLHPGASTPFWSDLTQALRTPPTVGQLTLLVRILDHRREAADPNQLATAEQFLRKNVRAASQQSFTRAEARQLVELRMGDQQWWDALKVLVRRMLASDPQDPLFRLYRLHVEGRLNTGSAPDLAELNAIVQEAVRRGDEATAQRAQHLIRAQKAPPPPSSPFEDEDDVEPWEDEDDAEPWEEEDDGEDDLSDAFEGKLPDLPPEVRRDFMRLLALLAVAPESEIALARRTIGKQLPPGLFDLLVQAARSGKLPPLPPPFEPGRKKPGASKPKWRPPEPGEDDPAQPNLL